jgi:hypothetical protein
MNNEQNVFSASDNFQMPARPSSFLNVLTILTIIGSIYTLFSSVWAFFSAQKSYTDLKKVMDSGDLDAAPAFVKGMVNAETLEMARKMMENKWPVMILGVMGAILCLYGAIEMRKLKKQGYFLWMAGEIIPILGMTVLIGMGKFGGLQLLGYLFPLAFIIMYTLHRKELVD